MKCKCGGTPRVLCSKLRDFVGDDDLIVDRSFVSRGVVWCPNCGLTVDGPIRAKASEAFLGACKEFETSLALLAEGEFDGN
jgi:hypothetical protein